MLRRHLPPVRRSMRASTGTVAPVTVGPFPAPPTTTTTPPTTTTTVPPTTTTTTVPPTTTTTTTTTAPPTTTTTVPSGSNPACTYGFDPDPYNVITSPAESAPVSSGFTVVGCANPPDMGLSWELLGEAGQVLASGSTTTTAGNGTVGDYTFTVNYSTASTMNGRILTYALDGSSRTHEATVALVLN